MTNHATFTPKNWPSEIEVEVRHDKADPETGTKEGVTVKEIWLDAGGAALVKQVLSKILNQVEKYDQSINDAKIKGDQLAEAYFSGKRNAATFIASLFINSPASPIPILDWLETLTGGLDYEKLEAEGISLFQKPE